ncbi:FAD-binding protein [Agathobaculum sp. LCP25S3_E8]|uniref:FAD-binding protein n=1 Tax=Agathobaculum sp. LCP25S3_E8 TaxID=3438735 RepID=UPI003F91587B
MIKTSICCAGQIMPVYALDTLVVGTGCAGFNAADWLYDLGRTDLAIVTEGIQMGTSRNTGSDKQTYYKLSLASDGADSVQEMAETLFSGGSVNGDTALAEAAGSVRSFMKLANLGVPFPTNEYGEYVGYKTDHDPRQRATSAGPLTSRFMTEALERSVQRKGIRIFNHMQAVRLLVEDGKVFGLLALDLTRPGPDGWTLFACEHILLATGGPAGVYDASVYPCGHVGMTGMALEAGAKLVNLQEWQYGLASTDFRWNVSGTYQQVLPRYISVDADGNEREFLLDYFDTPSQALDAVFLKGYQWPFDVRKVHGSSRIDLIIHHETVDLGRRVYMDFRTDPTGLDFSALSEETCQYLRNSGALLPTPIARLAKMNPDAIELYRAHGIDLKTQPLRVAVCAQHNNGGIAVDVNWQTNIQGLYAAGECAGTFGVYRPGGSALNACQVGSMRAAEHIAYTTKPQRFCMEQLEQQVEHVLTGWLTEVMSCLEHCDERSTSYTIRREMQQRMSAQAAHIRDLTALKTLETTLDTVLQSFFTDYKLAAVGGLAQMLRTRDVLLSQRAVVSAMRLAAEKWGSRGSGLVLDPDGTDCGSGLTGYRYRAPQSAGMDKQLITEMKADGISSSFTPIRPIPVRDDWFETVWSGYRARTGREGASNQSDRPSCSV